MRRSPPAGLTSGGEGGKLGFVQGYGPLRAHFAWLLLHDLLLFVRV